ncbi:hypothetical protein JVX90_20090 [Gordonia sp. PDNC005]|uniref:hypothetical protein n=1 Tax=unclassified Gordonia (in: high G+C Gram-positive bacteria) TaxID=2657482 RepID=UPI001966C9E6|nr:hypothetical protein [Gordonia sp. PDNC005]QRY62626.1 hypothetical protein JVX90_20090 [Gordonia sp. PDNC005]
MADLSTTRPAKSWQEFRLAHIFVVMSAPWIIFYFLIEADIGSPDVRTVLMRTSLLCAALCVGALLLRRTGPSAAATYPFAGLWAGLAAVSSATAAKLGDDRHICGGVGPAHCSPATDVIIGGMPVVGVVIIYAIASIFWNGVVRERED